ncbi:glycine cleavage system protein R [Vibrio sp. WXL103]|uniref:glycine cleavage system protein R n=1 Tax=unclassified Vibrio TaxID=2614977 RepID=UPI003EC7AF3F
MNSIFIVNFAGKAQPSTIKQLAAVTHENGGKWLTSKVNFIDEHVAAVIKVEVPRANESVVKDAFQAHPGLMVQIEDSVDHSSKTDTIHQVRLDANDRAGIVNEITHILDAKGISILDMDCNRVFVASGGGISSSLFSANMALKLAPELSIEDVTKDLEMLSEDTRVILES